jgi:hypothetical protein
MGFCLEKGKMGIKSFVVVFGFMAAVIMGDADLAEARGFGFRGGGSVNAGIGRSRNRAVRYYGPSFAVGPRTYGANRQGTTQYQQRPWYYSRSGPIEYYRPFNPLYRTR